MSGLDFELPPLFLAHGEEVAHRTPPFYILRVCRIYALAKEAEIVFGERLYVGLDGSYSGKPTIAPRVVMEVMCDENTYLSSMLGVIDTWKTQQVVAGESHLKIVFVYDLESQLHAKYRNALAYLKLLGKVEVYRPRGGPRVVMGQQPGVFCTEEVFSTTGRSTRPRVRLYRYPGLAFEEGLPYMLCIFENHDRVQLAVFKEAES